jgi:hypothetical protein
MTLLAACCHRCIEALVHQQTLQLLVCLQGDCCGRLRSRIHRVPGRRPDGGAAAVHQDVWSSYAGVGTLPAATGQWWASAVLPVPHGSCTSMAR